jgi:steroid delta-isomerase-like uncharacterized protein
MIKSRFWVVIAAAVIAAFGLSGTNAQGSSQEAEKIVSIPRLQATAAVVPPTAETLAANKKLVEQVVEDYVQHGAGRPSTRKGLQATYAAYRAAFPDIKWTIDFIGADGDKVFIYTTLTGTQKAPFNGIPATNKFVTINTADVFQVKDGVLAAHWDVYDQFSLLTQLGVLPSKSK